MPLTQLHGYWLLNNNLSGKVNDMENIIQEAKKNWQEKLAINEEKSLPENLQAELAEYESITNDELRGRLSVCKKELNRQWQEYGHKNPSSFYQNTRWYLYDLTLYHSNYGPCQDVFGVLNFCIANKLKKMLDFGAGIGSSGIIFAKAGLEVTLADISGILLDYARWRFKKRGLTANFINLSHQDLPEGICDVIIATDVFEHLANPKQEIKKIACALRNGGYLFFNITETEGDTHPMHISKAFHVLRHMRSCGFKKLKYIPIDMHRYQKVERPGSLNWFLGVYDCIYYALYYPTIFILQKLGLLSYLKKFLNKNDS
jgi:2-polyprenyl-3-methyl-5-hydroxy-6-metoxy-1,4-benzoquinol methylase